MITRGNTTRKCLEIIGTYFGVRNVLHENSDRPLQMYVRNVAKLQVLTHKYEWRYFRKFLHLYLIALISEITS